MPPAEKLAPEELLARLATERALLQQQTDGTEICQCYFVCSTLFNTVVSLKSQQGPRALSALGPPEYSVYILSEGCLSWSHVIMVLPLFIHNFKLAHSQRRSTS